MSTANQPTAQDDLESSTEAVVGKIVFAFSRFEFNLGLCLRSAVAGSNVNLVNPLVERLSFKHKLDALMEVVELQFATSAEILGDSKKWHRRMDALRTKRNAFVHGRWHVHASAQQIINVAARMPGAVPQRESRFTLDELRHEFAEIERAILSFDELRERWHF